jgi:hypothetical protein
MGLCFEGLGSRTGLDRCPSICQTDQASPSIYRGREGTSSVLAWGREVNRDEPTAYVLLGALGCKHILDFV